MTDKEKAELVQAEIHWNFADVGDTAMDLRNLFAYRVVKHGLPVLVLFGDDPALCIRSPLDDLLEDVLIGVISAWKNKRLETIYFCGFEDNAFWGGKKRDKIRFQNLIISGIWQGVDVHTSTTPKTLRHDWHLQLPGPIQRPRQVRDALEDSAAYAFPDYTPTASPEPRIFEAQTGQWNDPLCNACGNCERCFKLYSKELLDKAKEGRAKSMMLPASSSPRS